MKTLRKALITTSLIAFFVACISITASAETVSVTGTVQQKGGVYVLLTANDVYVLGGNQIPAEIIGKEIVVTGTVETKDKVKVIDLYIYDKVTPRPKKT